MRLESCGPHEEPTELREVVAGLVEDAAGSVEVQLHPVAHAQVRQAHLPSHAVAVVVSVVLYGRAAIQ